MAATISSWRSMFLCLPCCVLALGAGCGHSHSPVNATSILGSESSSIVGLEALPYLADHRRYTVYALGKGPAVLILHELPGLTPQCIQLARLLAHKDFRVYVPLLFGDAGVRATTLNFFRACVAGGYACFSSDDPGRIAHRMRLVSASIHAQSPTSPMGVIGMCLSGALPIALMRDPWIMAPVVSQPALPLVGRDAALGISASDLACARARGVRLLALRFSEDRLSPKARLAALEQALPGQVEPMVIDSRPGNPDGLPASAHAVLTEHPTQRALQKVIDFLNTHLRAAGATDLAAAPKVCTQDRS